MEGRPQKRSATSCNPLLCSGVLHTVLSYVVGEYLFMAPVSRWWREIYATLESKQLTFHDESGEKQTITCAPNMTLYSSVLATPTRVKLAHSSGLSCISRAYWRAAGRHADVATLATANELGMNYTKTTMTAAAQCNKPAEVQFLHNEGCDWPSGLLENASKSGFFELERWCYMHGCPFEHAIASETLRHAAQSGSIPLMASLLQQPGTELHEGLMCWAATKGRTVMCQYLHSRQCPWDHIATCRAAVNGHIDLLRWLVDNGCPWDAHQLCNIAVRCERVEVLMFLEQGGALTSATMLSRMLRMATQVFHRPAAAQWLREHGAV
jgi:hypothetical protein